MNNHIKEFWFGVPLIKSIKYHERESTYKIKDEPQNKILTIDQNSLKTCSTKRKLLRVP